MEKRETIDEILAECGFNEVEKALFWKTIQFTKDEQNGKRNSPDIDIYNAIKESMQNEI